jgi:hypothetical protein
VVEITQRRRGYFDPLEQKAKDHPGTLLASDQHGDFIYRAGCTVLIDAATQEVRRIIRTPGTVKSDSELERVRRFLTSVPEQGGNAFDAGLVRSLRADDIGMRDEPFALLHQEQES